MPSCIAGGIDSSGIWQNYSVAITATDPIGSIITNITCNLPWFMAFVLVMLYLALFILFNEIPGRKKYMIITLVPMVIAWVMIGFGWTSTILGDATTALFIITAGIVIAAGD